MEKTDLLAALDRAITAESEAQAFYLAAADKTDDTGGAAMFRELAAFESHHREHLKALKASLNERGAWIRYPARELSKAPAAEARARAASSDHADALEALRLAIATEEKAEAEYKNLAHQADDANGKQMFQRLAEEEAVHRKVLDDQYYALSNSGLWQWGD
ncbi:MAG: ferritin family protein [Deferrisomatales bacterium]|nr:ferritin family protein [Deferrisomatales bacterium]